jgi:hypothetical protein
MKKKTFKAKDPTGEAKAKAPKKNFKAKAKDPTDKAKTKTSKNKLCSKPIPRMNNNENNENRLADEST